MVDSQVEPGLVIRWWSNQVVESIAAARASLAVGSDSHAADRVPHWAEEAQSEGTSGGDSRAGNGRFYS